jgi:hypothetical protein
VNDTTAPAPVIARPRRAARLFAALAVLFGTFAGIVGVAAPAHAAGSYATGIYFCTTPNTNVSLERYSSGQTWAYKTGNSGPTGCATFRYVDAGYSYVVTRTKVTGNCTYGATMTVYASYVGTPRANTTVNVGTLGYWYSQRIC